MEFTAIVLTGGPGAGKTQAAEILQKRLESDRLHVLVVPETATRLILSGIDPRHAISNQDFQKAQLQMQIFMEDLFRSNASHLYKNQVLMICDRGALDGEGFIDPAVFQAILDELGLNRQELLKRYDAVFHLETAAKSSRKLYTLKNNKARKETADQAVEEDNQLIQTWSAHPCFQIIPAAETVEEKMDRLEAQVRNLLKKRAESASDHQ